MRTTRIIAVACAAAALACGKGGEQGERTAGSTEFVSRPPGGGGAGGTTAATPTNGAPGAATPDAAGSGGAAAPREIAEGDLYAASGSALHVLNGTRGLLSIDVADPARPRLAGRIPLTGRPVDLYLKDGVALFTVSDWWGWAVAADGAATPAQGSQLWAVDVRDPAAPRVLATLKLEGSLVTSRVVGSVLYAVTQASAWGPCVEVCVATSGGAGVGTVASMPIGGGGGELAIVSFDVSSPAAPREVARVKLPAPQSWEVHAHVTPERLVVAWPTWSDRGQVTRFAAFDVSDPAGAIAPGAEWDAPGRLRDRWSMDHDGAAGVFRAVLEDGWNAGATVRTWAAATAGAPPSPLGSLRLDVRESLTAARFDGARGYVVTAVQRDPLWVVDLADPARPALLGHLEMPGRLEYVEPRGDRLVALGRGDDVNAWRLHVSLFDVAGATPVLLGRVLFGGEYGWVPAAADDVRKAFQVLDAQGLVLVPFESHDRTSWTSTGGTQLIDLARDGLTLRGFLPHAGAIQRAFPLPGRPGTLAALSDQRLQIVDAADRGAPRELAALDLARPVWDLAVAGDHLVELAGEQWRGGAELVVVPKDDPDAASPLARVALGGRGARIFQRGSIAWVLTQDERDGSAALEAHDFTDPARPRARGRVVVSAAGGSGVDAVPAPAAPLLAVTRWGYGAVPMPAGAEPMPAGAAPMPAGAAPMPAGAAPVPAAPELQLYDLADPDAPRLASSLSLEGASGGDLRWYGATLWFTRYDWTDRTGGWVRFWLERVDATDPRAPRRLGAVNVPGALLAATDDGRRAYTLETSWSDPARGKTVLHALDLEGTVATLRASASVDGWAAGAAVHGGFAYAIAGEWTPAGARSRLAAVDLGAMRVASEVPLAGGSASVLGAAGSKLLLSTWWPQRGVLVYDLADRGRPAFVRSVPVQGWAWSFVADATRAWLPAGEYGVAVVPLAP